MATKSVVFVSYSHRDQDVAVGLAKEFQELGANIWIDQLGIKLGQQWDSSIEAALEEAGTLIVLISNSSVASRNVQDEVSIAIDENKKIVPIMIEQCDLPMRWKRMQYADFIENPDKSLNDVLEALEIERPKGYISDRIDKILHSLRRKNKQASEDLTVEKVELESTSEVVSSDILISEEEMEKASEMHRNLIKTNKITIISVLIGSILLMALLLFVLNAQPQWLVVLGSILINILSIRPYGNLRNSAKTIELIELAKLKRTRLIRIIDRLSDEEIENFNQEFDNYLTI